MPSSRKVRLTRPARRDLHGILRHSLNTWGPAQRDLYRARLDRAFQLLTEFPELGRARDEFGEGVRSHRVEQHVVFYRQEGNVLRIIRVLHVKMEPVGRLDEDQP